MKLLGSRGAIPEAERAAKATSILLLVGVIDLPIIHYSVYCWNTLHQQSTLLKLGSPIISSSMLYPLLAMIAAFRAYFAAVMLMSCLLPTAKIVFANFLPLRGITACGSLAGAGIGSRRSGTLFIDAPFVIC
jgi:ABC-type transport system involved in cytochrome c biogenesis permease subunit